LAILRICLLSENTERKPLCRRYRKITSFFSVGIISIEESEPHYLDFFALDSRNVEERRKAIDVLENISIYSNNIDVVPEDQLLILVTCVKKDEERRVVAARRIRDGESQKELKALAEKADRPAV